MANTAIQCPPTTAEPPTLTHQLDEDAAVLAFVTTALSNKTLDHPLMPVHRLDWTCPQQLELPLEDSHVEQQSFKQQTSQAALSPHVQHSVHRIQSIVDGLVNQYLPVMSAQLTAELTKVIHDYLHTTRQNTFDPLKKP